MKSITTKKFYESISKKWPKIKFKYYRKNQNTKPVVHGSIINNDTNIGFNVYISMSDKNTFRARYYFGKMKIDPKSLFFINGFNDNSPYDYKAILALSEGDYKNGDLEIVGSFRATDSEEATERFIKITDYLFDKNMKDGLIPLIKLVDKQKYNPIEEMN